MPNASQSAAPGASRSPHPQPQHQQHHHQYQSRGHQALASTGTGSWIEVDSQPSSSSLSSIGGEIITTGLRVGGGSAAPPGPHSRRRRPSQHNQTSLHPIHHHQHAQARAAMAHQSRGRNSQEAFDETESEEDHERRARDRIATRNANANSAIAVTLPVIISDADAESSESDDDDDDGGGGGGDDDAATALGRVPAVATTAASPRSPVFQPQPNAFSHPPHLPHRHSLPYGNVRPQRSSVSRNGGMHRQSSASASGNGPGHGTSPPLYREDNDAALRASLTTLLSYATAARGLQKTASERTTTRASGASAPSGSGSGSGSGRGGPVGGVVGFGGVAGLSMGRGVGPSSQPVELTLVAENELPDGNDPILTPAVAEPAVRPPTSRQRTSGPPRPAVTKQASASADKDKPKRNSTLSSGNSRVVKKKRASLIGGDEALLSPTVLTWVVGASVVVLFSVVGFGAGYVIGREAGKQEGFAVGMSGSVNSLAAGTAARVAAEGASSCGRQAVVLGGGGGGLKKLRWGGSIMSSGVTA